MFPYKLVDGKAILLSAKELETQYPVAWQYLKENKSLLEARELGKWKHDKWYQEETEIIWNNQYSALNAEQLVKAWLSILDKSL